MNCAAQVSYAATAGRPGNDNLWTIQFGDDVVFRATDSPPRAFDAPLPGRRLMAPVPTCFIHVITGGQGDERCSAFLATMFSSWRRQRPTAWNVG
jgi:hypothetical protein